MAQAPFGCSTATRLLDRHFVGSGPRDDQRDRRDEHVQRDSREGRHEHVVHAQQVEAGRETADDRAGNVAAVEEPEP